MSQPTGVRFKAEKRRELALKAAELSETRRTKAGRPDYMFIGVELDVSEPTARSLVAFGLELKRAAADGNTP